MTDQGLITLKFSSEVFFPSYMLENFDESSEVDEVGSQAEDDIFGLNKSRRLEYISYEKGKVG